MRWINLEIIREPSSINKTVCNLYCQLVINNSTQRPFAAQRNHPNSNIDSVSKGNSSHVKFRSYPESEQAPPLEHSRINVHSTWIKGVTSRNSLYASESVRKIVYFLRPMGRWDIGTRSTVKLSQPNVP